MSELGSTTFGYVIAYLLPGLAGSVAIALLSKHAEKIFHVVITQQNLALGLMGALGAMTIGLFLTLFRGLIFEEWFFRSDRLSNEEHSELSRDEDTYRGYRALIDEVYRYHQFWGAMALVLPLLLIGALMRGGSDLDAFERIALSVGVIGAEVATIWAALATYRRYLERMRIMLAADEASES